MFGYDKTTGRRTFLDPRAKRGTKLYEIGTKGSNSFLLVDSSGWVINGAYQVRVKEQPDASIILTVKGAPGGDFEMAAWVVEEIEKGDSRDYNDIIANFMLRRGTNFYD